ANRLPHLTPDSFAWAGQAPVFRGFTRASGGNGRYVSNMLSATEERSVPKPDRQAIERNLEEVHRRLDEYEGEIRERLGRGWQATKNDGPPHRPAISQAL